MVGGNLRFADVQGKVVLIGLTASGVASNTFPDSRLDPVPGVIFQARAVSSLLSPPFRPVSLWLSGLACAALAALAVWLGGLWGFGLALLALALSAALYFPTGSFPAPPPRSQPLSARCSWPLSASGRCAAWAPAIR